MTNKRLRKQVLIIDDNPVVCFFLEGYFKTKGYAVFFAETAQRGMDMALNMAPDLVLVQGKLPDHTGIAVIQHLRKKPATAHVPVVYYTGSHKERMRFKLNPPDATWYLHSPWDAARLHDIICEDIFMDEGDGAPDRKPRERNHRKRKAL